MRLHKTRQDPARAGGEAAFGDDLVDVNAHFRGGARRSSKDQTDHRAGAFGLREREGFGQFVDERLGEGLDFDGGHF